MKQLLRERSVQLRLQAEEPSVNVFGVLKELGVLPADHLVAVQALPGQVFDVTFKTVEIRKQFWPSMSASCKFTATSYASNMKIVTVLHVPHELDDNVFGWEILRVRYPGQPRTCLKCGEEGHLAKDCAVIRCYNCHEVGHSARNCQAPSSCTTCGKSGHGYKACPVSFANKLHPTTAAWVSGGASVLPETQEEGKSASDSEMPVEEKVSPASAASETTTSEGPLKALSDTPDVVMEEEVVSIAMGSWSSEMEEVNIVKQSSLVVETTGENALFRMTSTSPHP
ncbi:putative zinc finger CCHC domain-containing protein 3-like [Apostichopus japonicus]|uniref:Putative zinc finger CCHC domain-containing protein 3-like n=1 Tax=Stichopus japonicus TaxID=307972 RepID=A0A2G8KBP4_STIJA|nr:putative zinc finger CCHC domain-containing protein 3-like [Apostichopus japonicus]